jgi:hypothetical protein
MSTPCRRHEKIRSTPAEPLGLTGRLIDCEPLLKCPNLILRKTEFSGRIAALHLEERLVSMNDQIGQTTGLD